MAAPRRTTTQRGLGWVHEQQVANLKRMHIEGTPCWYCGEAMYLAQGLSGDHSIPRALGGTRTDRLLHRDCNSARGDGSRDHQRPALTGEPMPVKVDQRIALGPLAMPWP